ncbi:zinc ribbon domain-containing protein [Herbivorax sp. ANBcel31]|uniref:zinc ribbon domain-containing protein n=1 Tax=Herbivorax sp. ANBcel31 TaxID=3069754 RepID=UPI0027B3D14E|nr:zinc ribbon domain-containing protein [Herbivorax sp. ANBcel31]MDQ2087323.1 zinc ribbon domain-containing protein [Herbivorax sp. ANBcel31]
MEEKYCQSCGMPMGDTDEMYGSNLDGSKNKDYCEYCYMNGKFTSDISIEEMIEVCIPHVVNEKSGMSENEAREMMKELLPKLKRWS